MQDVVCLYYIDSDTKVDMSNFERIDYQVENQVAYIRLNQPDILNAMSGEMGQEIMQALEMGEHEARAIVLGSHGRAFCSGANLSGGGNIDLNDPQRDMGIRLERIFNPMFLKIRDLPVPFITSVRGPAVGFGSGLALMGDIIIASKTAFFLQTFCKIGLASDGAAAYLMSRSIGRIKAMELMLLGERYHAEQAYQDGLVTRLVEDSELDEVTTTIAEKLASGPPISLKLIRRSAWAALDSSFPEQLARERDEQRLAGRTEDFIEGVAAFREKRKANFSGK